MVDLNLFAQFILPNSGQVLCDFIDNFELDVGTNDFVNWKDKNQFREFFF